MEELSIEEKAKGYDDALERAKSAIKECGNNVGRIKMIESIFPELKESEEEKVRKQIINHLDFLARGAKGMDNSPEYSKYTSWIAYLEKLKDFDEQLDEAYKTADEVQYNRGYLAAKAAEKSTGFGELVHSKESRGVNSAYGIGFLEGAVWSDEHPIHYDGQAKADVFIEKACVNLKKLMYDNLMFQGRLHREEVINSFVEDFKKTMKEE